ncbi:arylsulfatase [uncultured Maribacter sp.]|uniref:arylsulfatase n=2 Tax=Flavobacteriaceae TaxID=49546 RepID=UPI002637AE14|nr:arylsulfatase [uncultured Maribacter sp.]
MKKNCSFYTFYSKNTFFNIRCILLCITVCLAESCKTENPKEVGSPNIIVIMADDLGYSDLGCYGGEISTPTLDNLASEGIRLPNVFNAGMCVASRSAMLTGKWWPRAGFGAQNGPNIAQELKKEGYRTGLIGKWHLDGTPNKKGFDYFFGFLGGYSSYFKGGKDYRINEQKYEDFGNSFYSTDAFSERAVEFVKSNNGQNKEPFFLYLSYQSPHNPLQAPKEDIMKYRGSYLKGWQSVREQRIEKQKSFGLIAAEASFPEYPQNLPDWNTLTDAQKDLEDLRMSVYAAMVERMDKGIGQLMDALKATNQDKNTLILFLSDNGTDSFSVLDKTLLKKGLLPGDLGANYQLGTGWAYTSVSPLRLYKISQHSGGVKTGAIVKWPQSIPKPNSISTEAINVVDFMPTFLEAAKTSSESEDNKLVGQSFIPLLKGKTWKREDPMYFQFMDNRAIRTSEWSLIEVDDNGWELYNTIEDPLETNDVSQVYHEKVLELEKEWLNWWVKESGELNYKPESTADSPHYKSQGDRGTGVVYTPSAMPARLSEKYKLNR